MNYVGRLLSNFKGFYNEINSATLTGAIDIVIVKQEDGTCLTSPWHVRFGKLGVLRSREKVVDIEINGEPVDIQMKLGEAGEAFFVEEAKLTREVPAHLATSPLPDALQLMERGLKELHESPGLDSQLDNMPTIIHIEEDFTPKEDPLAGLEENRPPILRLHDDVTPTNDNQALLKEITIVVDQCEQNSGINLENSAVHFCPVTDKETQDTGIQTEMSGAEVETKAKRSRLTSGESCRSHTTSNSTGPPPSLDKLPTFVRIDSDADIKQAAKEKRRKRRKRSPASKAREIPKTTAKPKSTHLDIHSTESGSSGDPLEEAALFDLELSEDETDNAMLMSTMGRTVSMPLIEDKHAYTDEWANSQYAAALHPFSDGDITPVVSPLSSRPPSPKSDTELDTIKDATCQTHLTGDELSAIDSVRWRWGELPENCEQHSKTNIAANTQNNEEKPSGGLFQFMRKTKKMRHQPEQEGIYLDDLNLTEMDPEVAALYLYQTKQSSQHALRIAEDDSESGRGASLPQSPITVEGAGLHHSTNNMTELSLSLCGGLKEAEGMIAHDIFLQGLVTYDEFCENPDILFNSNLVLKMGDKYYNWQTAGPIIMSVLAFQRPLPEEAIDNLAKKYMPKKETQRRRGWMWWGRSGTEPNAAKDKDSDAVPTNISSAPSSPQKPKSKKKKVPTATLR